MASGIDFESVNVTPRYVATPSIPSPDLNGHNLVKGLVETLLGYGGYIEITDLLVNLTSVAEDIGRMAMEEARPHYGLTLLAPNDEAMATLGPQQLEDPNLPERLLYYHLIAGYLTEESMYVRSRRHGTVKYETMLVPFTVWAKEADGTVKVVGGQGRWAHLVDADVSADGKVSVQEIDRVIFPPDLDTGGHNRYQYHPNKTYSK